ncbi:hypothetical protein SNK03_009309 [Fusarium graminearum]|nr:unnamed protein product [Fusarium graminearum]CAG1966716.1 unnamed protein product [Fusarium graminearum]VTO85665.1 unnamed protein product [Fusarium graminearum]
MAAASLSDQSQRQLICPSEELAVSALYVLESFRLIQESLYVWAIVYPGYSNKDCPEFAHGTKPLGALSQRHRDPVFGGKSNFNIPRLQESGWDFNFNSMIMKSENAGFSMSASSGEKK